MIYLTGEQQALKVPEDHGEEDVNSCRDSVPGAANRVLDVPELLSIAEV